MKRTHHTPRQARPTFARVRVTANPTAAVAVPIARGMISRYDAERIIGDLITVIGDDMRERGFIEDELPDAMDYHIRAIVGEYVVKPKPRTRVIDGGALLFTDTGEVQPPLFALEVAA